MSGPDTSTRADYHWSNVTERASWWRVIDAQMLWPAINAPAAVWGLYETEGAKR